MVPLYGKLDCHFGSLDIWNRNNPNYGPKSPKKGKCAHSSSQASISDYRKRGQKGSCYDFPYLRLTSASDKLLFVHPIQDDTRAGFGRIGNHSLLPGIPQY